MVQWDKDDLEVILQDHFFGDPGVFGLGRRNDDAVDFSCICWCLGYNPIDKFNELRVEQQWNDGQYNAAREHMDRVQPYLNKWGTKGTMEAMNYSISYKL